MNILRKVYRFLFRGPQGEDLVRSLGVRFGRNCKFITVNRYTFGSEPYLIELGDHVELAANVKFLPHDGSVWVFREKEPDIDLMIPIKVGNNVFIGYGAIILRGAVIGDNCIIGAGSVVTGVIPSNSVAAGVPAKVIKSLDNYREKIDLLLIPTKKMSKEQKKSYLFEHFQISEKNN